MAPLLRMSVSGAGRLLEDRPRELVASSGGDRHLDARVNRAGDGGAVRVGNLSVAIENGAVEIERDQANHCQGSGLRAQGPGLRAQIKLTAN